MERDEIGRRQNCTRLLNCTEPKLHECTKLHEDAFARGLKITQKEINCTKTILYEGSNLHELQFCTETLPTKGRFSSYGIKPAWFRSQQRFLAIMLA